MEAQCPNPDCLSNAVRSYLPIHDKINNEIKVSGMCDNCGETWDSFFGMSRIVRSEGETIHFE